MTSSNMSDQYSNNPPSFGRDSLQNFDVYTDRNEPLGKVVSTLPDAANHSEFLVVDLGSWANSKQIVLPLNYVLVDQRSHRVLVLGMTRSQVLALPAYNTSNSTSRSAAVDNSGIATTGAPLFEAAATQGNQELGQATNYQPIPPTSYQQNFPPTSVEQNYQPVPPNLSQQNFSQPSVAQNYPAVSPNLNQQNFPQSSVEQPVRLLEERLVVDRKKRKVGEVIVRKEIETHMVEVPVRREKLIVEQVSPERKQLASFAVGQSPIDGVEFAEDFTSSTQSTVSGEFTSAKAASQFLQAIASQPAPGLQRIQLSIVVENADLQRVYQQWMEHYSAETVE